MVTPSGKDHFSNLPVELLLIIREQGDLSTRDLASLSATSWRLNEVFEELLYLQGQGATQKEPCPIVLWATCFNRVGTLKKLFKAGASFFGHRVSCSYHHWVQRRLRKAGFPYLLGGPIHYAAALGNREALEFLLDQGASVDAPCPVRFLLSLQPGLTAMDQPEIWALGTSLHLAVAHVTSSVETIRDLVKWGACIEGGVMRSEKTPLTLPRTDITPLSLAVRLGRWDIAVALLELGAKFDTGSPLKLPWTGDMASIRRGSIIVDALVKQAKPGSLNAMEQWEIGRENFIRQMVEERGLNLNHYFLGPSGEFRTPLQHYLRLREVPRPNVIRILSGWA
ncbi:hypothetical protein V8F20_010963 [Naviculisporaceae sp. PSN 640]